MTRQQNKYTVNRQSAPALPECRGFTLRASYLTDAVATGRGSYYTGAVSAGEPPGRWHGADAELLGLCAEVDPQDMRALHERFLDPREPAFGNPDAWAGAKSLGRRGRLYVTEEELFKGALDNEPNATPERQAEHRFDADKRARKNVAHEQP